MAAMGRRRDGVEERACVLLAADRDGLGGPAASVASALAAALEAGVETVRVDLGQRAPHASAAAVLTAAERLHPAPLVLAPDHLVEGIAGRLQSAGFRVAPIRSHALPGSIAADIAEVARDVGAGLIVVGGGRGPPLSLLRGGVSHDLLRLAPCPVVIQR
jgi:nucleotide-binding universal stress UspA family protein